MILSTNAFRPCLFPGQTYLSLIHISINNTYTGTPLTISCEKCNSAVLLDTPDDIAYLYRLAQENPLLYAELACKPNGLQEYVDAMNEFN